MGRGSVNHQCSADFDDVFLPLKRFCDMNGNLIGLLVSAFYAGRISLTLISSSSFRPGFEMFLILSTKPVL